MVRDEELSRLIKYAQGMGVSVKFKPYIKYSKYEAEWSTDGTEIIIYVTKRSSKINKILSLIHELAHHKSFVDNNRQIDPKVEEAIDSDKNKQHRKCILDYETKDTAYWEDIYRDTNCQFDIRILHKQKEEDIWTYQIFYETGKFPSRFHTLAKRKELTKKYGVR